MNPLYAGIAGLALLLALVVGVGKWEKSIEQRGYDRAAKVYAEAALRDEQKQRAEEGRRETEQTAALAEANQRAATARADAAAATAAHSKLQRAIDAAKLRAASPDSTVAERSETAATLGNLFSVCSARYTVLGVGADQARTAGQLCERFYDSLTPISDKLKAMTKGPP